jgi:HSP20 family molecular chaperone IbpA
MTRNVLKKPNGAPVDQSLEATRSIEFQLLNMKNELEKYTLHDSKDLDVNLAPAVVNTLETLQQIDHQLKNMRNKLDEYSKDVNQPKKIESMGPTEPTPPPFPPTSPPPYPPPYPLDERQYPPPPFNPPVPPQYNPYLSPYPPPYYYPLPPWYYHNPYGMQYFHRYYGPRDYPPQYQPQNPPLQGQNAQILHPLQQPIPPQQPLHPLQTPPLGYYPENDYERYAKYYESAKYPTVANSEPAYSSASKAIPSQVFKIAYYPWEQLMGKKNPINSRIPYVNLYDLGGEYLVYIELPGVEKEDIELRVDEQMIWINGKPTIIGGEDGTPIVQEHGFHEFSRNIYLPSVVLTNKTSCKFDNGILKILLIKKSAKKPGHRVKIK